MENSYKLYRADFENNLIDSCEEREIEWDEYVENLKKGVIYFRYNSEGKELTKKDKALLIRNLKNYGKLIISCEEGKKCPKMRISLYYGEVFIGEIRPTKFKEYNYNRRSVDIRGVLENRELERSLIFEPHEIGWVVNNLDIFKIQEYLSKNGKEYRSLYNNLKKDVSKVLPIDKYNDGKIYINCDGDVIFKTEGKIVEIQQSRYGKYRCTEITENEKKYINGSKYVSFANCFQWGEGVYLNRIKDLEAEYITLENILRNTFKNADILLSDSGKKNSNYPMIRKRIFYEITMDLTRKNGGNVLIVEKELYVEDGYSPSKILQENQMVFDYKKEMFVTTESNFNCSRDYKFFEDGKDLLVKDENKEGNTLYVVTDDKNIHYTKDEVFGSELKIVVLKDLYDSKNFTIEKVFEILGAELCVTIDGETGRIVNRHVEFIRLTRMLIELNDDCNISTDSPDFWVSTNTIDVDVKFHADFSVEKTVYTEKTFIDFRVPIPKYEEFIKIIKDNRTYITENVIRWLDKKQEMEYNNWEQLKSIILLEN